MMSIGAGSSRPDSSIATPGSSQATASRAGNWVTAANSDPGSHGRRPYHPLAAATRLAADLATAAIGATTRPAPGRARPPSLRTGPG